MAFMEPEHYLYVFFWEVIEHPLLSLFENMTIDAWGPSKNWKEVVVSLEKLGI